MPLFKPTCILCSANVAAHLCICVREEKSCQNNKWWDMQTFSLLLYVFVLLSAYIWCRIHRSRSLYLHLGPQGIRGGDMIDYLSTALKVLKIRAKWTE